MKVKLAKDVMGPSTAKRSRPLYETVDLEVNGNKRVKMVEHRGRKYYWCSMCERYYKDELIAHETDINMCFFCFSE